MPDSVSVVAVANEFPSHDYLVVGFNAFNKSLSRFGHSPMVLGWAERWRGLGSKPKYLKSAIEGGRIKTSHIIFSDAYDVWFGASPDEILEASSVFLPNKIVWNAEKNCFPDAGLASHFKKTWSPFRYLNSGLSIGPTESYLECLREMDVDSWPDDHQNPDGSWFHKNDQDDWMRRFLFGQCPGQVPMCLDSECILFQTLCDVSETDFEFEWKSSKIKNRITGSFPMAFHANGGSKTSGVMEKILITLGL